MRPSFDVLAAAEAVLDLASRDERFRTELNAAFMAVHERLRDPQRPIITGEQITRYDQIRGAAPRVAIPGVTQESVIALLESGVNLRAEAALRSAPMDDWRQAVVDGMARVPGALQRLFDDFLGDFLVAADPKQLQGSAERISATRPRVEAAAEQLTAYLDNDGLDECDCVAHACNGAGDCRDFCILSWWECILLILGFIVVLIFAIA